MLFQRLSFLFEAQSPVPVRRVRDFIHSGSNVKTAVRDSYSISRYTGCECDDDEAPCTTRRQEAHWMYLLGSRRTVSPNGWEVGSGKWEEKSKMAKDESEADRRWLRRSIQAQTVHLISHVPCVMCASVHGKSYAPR